MRSHSFARFVAEKERAAAEAVIGRLVTEQAGSRPPSFLEIGNDWTRARYDGPFLVPPARASLPAVSLVFVQSRDGDTVVDDPSELGGGATDLHLIYEGLSRVAADAVLAGATTAAGPRFFSVWVPEIVALRQALGLNRHPDQIVVSRKGRLDFDRTLLFNVPAVRVFVLAGEEAVDRCRRASHSRSWMTVIPIDRDDLESALRRLRGYGIGRISAIGGRSIASSLIDAGVVQDICLTTTDKRAGKPGTPFYSGLRRLQRDLIVRKRSVDAGEAGITVEQSAISIAD